MLHEPELVILDEPFSGLDPVNMELMRDTIVHLAREGRTVIFSTHVMAQAEEICDFIFLINRGKKVLDGTLREVKGSGGEEAIHIAYDGDGSALDGLRGVARVNDAGKTAEIFLEDGTDPQHVLEQLVTMVKLRRYDLREPSLHEIFVRSVGGKTDA